MIPVDMIHLKHGQPDAICGDCFRACIASMLEMPSRAVPHFMSIAEKNGTNWVDLLQKFLASRALFYIQVDDVPPWLLTNNVPPLVVTAGGKSPRGDWEHAVVGELSRDGFKMTHDPHPSRDGILGEPMDYGMFLSVRMTK